MSLCACSIFMTAVAFIYELLSKWLRKIQSCKWRYYTWILIFIGFIMIYKPSFGGTEIRLDGGDWISAVTDGNSDISPEGFALILKYCGVFAVWFFGFLFKLCYMLIKQHRFVKSVSRLSKPVPKEVSDMAVRVASEVGTCAKFKAVTLKEISSPMVTGIFSPLLILPDRRFSDKELYLILKHELVHLKRRDLVIKTFMLFCGSVHWFNPFIRRFIRCAEREGELYCDETVVGGESEETKKLYCRSILDTVSADTKNKNTLVPAVASNFSFNKTGLKQRMSMILSFNRRYRLGIVGIIVLILVLYTGKVLSFGGDYEPYYEAEGAVTTTFAVTEVVFTDNTAITSTMADAL